MPNVTCKALREGYVALKKLTGNTEIPLSRGLEFSRARTALEPDVEEIDSRDTGLLRDHAERDDEGQIVTTPQGGIAVADQEAYFEERQKLLNEVAEIPEFHPVDVETLERWDEEFDSLELSGDDVFALVRLGIATRDGEAE